MIKIEVLEIAGFAAAIHGMRNPLNSWDKSDTDYNGLLDNDEYTDIWAGPKDAELMRKLCAAGPEHRKFLRMIVVYADITAPRYWWTEFDTYKVGTVANSCSTMHTIMKKPFEMDDFSHEHLQDELMVERTFETDLSAIIDELNLARGKYIETKDKFYWWQVIQLLPQSYNQKRTVMLNYETLRNIYAQRRGHKLDEWAEFRKLEENLPCSWLITGGDD